MTLSKLTGLSITTVPNCVESKYFLLNLSPQRVCETCGKVLKNSKCYYNHLKIHLRSVRLIH